MKKLFIIFLPVVLMAYSCGLTKNVSEEDENKKFRDISDLTLYKDGREWNYKVVISDSLENIVDSFSLVKRAKIPTTEFYRKIWEMNIFYDYIRDGEIFQTEGTGVYENKTQISIHPPRKYPLDFTEIPPFPKAFKNLDKENFRKAGFIGKTSVYNFKYYDKRKQKSVNLAMKKIKTYLAPVDIEIFKYKDKDVFCFIYEGENTNKIKKLGKFTCKYYFNEEYGFVKLTYNTPWNEVVNITLESTNF